jgi:hypothetical protein
VTTPNTSATPNQPTPTESSPIEKPVNQLTMDSIVTEADTQPPKTIEEVPAWNFWDDLFDSIPPWFTEVMSFVVIVFGLLSFLALFNTTDNTSSVATTWRNILVTMFGYGSWIIAVCIFAIGIYGLIQRVFQIRLASMKILAIEIGVLCGIALLHLWYSDTELRAIARAGEGGGMVGWGLALIPHALFGRIGGLVIYGAILALCVAILLGVQRARVIYWFTTNGDRLLRYSDKIFPPTPKTQLVMPQSNPVTPTLPTAPTPVSNTNKRNPIMRIRANFDNLPPSQRPNAQPTLVIPQAKPKVDDELAKHPLFTASGRELKIDLNIVGDLTNRKTEDGYRIVRRPDGREKRYFSVEQMKEVKRVAKREKSLPALEIMQEFESSPPDEQEINRNVVLIENTLLEFDIDIDVIDVQVGPTVTRYAVQPFQSKKDGSTERTRLSKIASYVSDLSLSLSAKRLRLEIPVPGTNYMGIEVPNKQPGIVTLRSVYESKMFFDLQQKNQSPLLVPLGRDVSGQPFAIDLSKLPHLLIAGTTGSGKSVAIAAIAASVVLSNTPEAVKMVMLDPKMVELSRFNGLPHLLGPVETDTDRIIGVLKWCTREMDRRYKLLEEHAVRNIDNYNAKFGMRRRGRDYLPYILIMVDEIGDLMLSRPEETETAITRLAQMARAVGMHLVIATQRPSVDVITGLIKANFPGRIAFSVASGVDSRVILDSVGAESLLGRGDMLFLAQDAAGPKRIQGCYIADEEVRQIVKHWTDWYAEEVSAGRAELIRTGPWERGLTRREFLAETDPMLEDAIEFVVETQEASASIIQRRLGLGYPRAARIMDMLEELGVIGEAVGGGRARRVVIPKGEDPFKRIIESRMKTGNKPLKSAKKPVQEYYDDADLDGDDSEKYYLPNDNTDD